MSQALSGVADRSPIPREAPSARLDLVQRATLLATIALFSAGYAPIGLVGVLGTVIMEGITTGRVPWRRSPLDALLVAFIAVYLLSGVLSSYRLIAIGETIMLAVTIYFTFGPLYQLLERDRNFLNPFLWTWGGGGVAAAVWGAITHLITRSLASTWAIGPTALGTTLLIAVALSVGLLSARKDVWKFLWAAVGIPVLLLGLALTYSRGAWGGAAVALGVFFLLVELRHTWRAFLLLILVGLAGAGFIALAHPAIDPAVIKRVEGTTFNLSRPHWRVFLARSALAIFADHPLLGTGFGTFSLVYPKYRLPDDPNPLPVPFAHNIFLNTAAEGGALGLAALTAILAWAAVAGWQWYARSPSPRETLVSAAVLSAFTGMLTQQLFDGTIQSVNLGAGLWFLVAILAAFRP